MTIQTYWQLDVAADPGRSEPSTRPRRQPELRDVRTSAITRYDHYAQIARAAALTGFDGLFLPHRTHSDDSQIVAAAIAREVPRLTLVPEFPASVGSAVYAAKQAASFQRLAHERLGWAIAPDEDAQARARLADPVADEDLIGRTEEFLTVARGVHGQRGYSFKGRFFEVENGGFEAQLNRVRFPTVFLRGNSEEALALSARQADVHLFDPAPFDQLRAAVETLDGLASAAGRSVGFGLIQPLHARELEEELGDAPPGALAGTYDAVANALARFGQLGIDHLVLTAAPSLEEAYRVGQFVLPRLRALTEPARAAA